VEPSLQRSLQSRLAGLLSLVRPDGQIHHAGARQADDGHGTSDRQSHAGPLCFGVRVLRLVLRRVGHGEGETVDQFRVVFAVPQPATITDATFFTDIDVADEYIRANYARVMA